MFQFPEFALQTYVFSLRFHDVTHGWFPYSDIAGSKFAYNSPTLFAVSHVFHRFRLPRHPPYTLSSLAIKLLEYPKDMTRIKLCFSIHLHEWKNLFYQITKFQRALQNSTESEKLFYSKKFIYFNHHTFLSSAMRRHRQQSDGGGERDRTDDLHGASVTLSQLSYTPILFKSGGPRWIWTIDLTLIRRAL